MIQSKEMIDQAGTVLQII